MNNSDTSHYENVPFEVPESWEWVTVGDIFTHNTGKALNSSNSQGEIMSYITTSNLYWNRFDLSVIKEMPFTESEVAKCTVTRGDLLVCEGGDIGRAAIWNYDFDIRIQNHIHRLRSIIQLNHLFYYHVFYLFKSLNLIGGKGVAIQGLSSSDLAKLLVPLPPISEQNRIVSELNRWLSVVDQIELDQYSLKNTIADIKNRILCLAISGKLVGQDISDEPAIELLKKINPSYISCDNRHYANVPETWEVVALKDVTEIITGSTPSKSVPAYYSGDVPFYKPNDLDQGRHVRTASEHLSQQGKEISRSIPSNSIAVCCIGSIGKCGYIEHEGVTNQQINTIIPNEAIFPLYLFYFCNSTSFIDKLKSQSSAVTIPIVNKSKLSTIQIPLPPISEQKRIVNAIETILHKLDIIVGEIL